MQIGNPMTQSLAVGQPVSTSDNASGRGLFQGLREAFSTYDPLKGTQRKIVPSMALMAGAASAGAVSMDTLVKNWTPVAEPAGTALVDRFVTVVENTVQKHPWVCGAVAGAATALVGLNMLATSMKPITRDCVETVMEGLRHQLHRDFQQITVLNELIAQHRKKMSELEELLPKEKDRYKRLSQKSYENRLALFREQANSKAKYLKGYVDGVLWSGRSNPMNVLRGVNLSHIYRAGAELERFASKENQDYSSHSQRQLLDALKPVLSEHQYREVKAMLREFPIKPPFLAKRGPIAKEYAEVQEQKASDQREVGVLQSNIRKVLTQYPILNPDAAGNVPKPPFKTFLDFMPK